MNIFHKVTLQTLKRNKTRTTVTIIGIILSAAMICAVTTFASSIQNFLLKDAIYSKGNYYGRSDFVTQDKIDEIIQDSRLSQLALSQNVGYAVLEGYSNDHKPYLYIMGVDSTFLDTMPVHLTSGTLPSDSTQILIPEHILYSGEVNLKIGDTITLDVGQRIADDDTQHPLTQNNPYSYDDQTGNVLEQLVPSGQRTYTVVGFYERPDFEDFSSPGFSVLTRIDENSAGSTFDIFIKTKNAKDIYDFMSEYELGYTTNTDVLRYSGASQYNGFYSVLYGFVIIVVVLIMFGSISLIYNAFSISVSERTKQFGLLSSIGATKKQLRKSVIFEAMFVSSIGIPIGILCGIGGIGTTLYLLRDKMSYLFGGRVQLSIHVSWLSVIAAAVIAIATVFISVWIPSKRATKVDAITAIRQTNDITAKSKDVKISPLTYRLFGLEGMIAKKHFKRSRKKYRATIVSLFMSVVLFISASAFSMYLTDSVKRGFDTYGYDIACSFYDSGDTTANYNGIYQQLQTVSGVTDSAFTKTVHTNIFAEGPELSESCSKYVGDSSGIGITLRTVFVDDEVFRQYLTENGLDTEKYMSAENTQALVYDYHKQMDYDNGRYIFYSYFDYSSGKIDISTPKTIPGLSYSHLDYDEDGNYVAVYYNSESSTTEEFPKDEVFAEQSISIGQQVYDLPWCISNDFCLMYPMSAYDNLSSMFSDSQPSVKMLFKSSSHAVTADKMGEILERQGTDFSYDITDYAEYAEENRGIVTVINVFAYGFIILISLIAVANVFNTISTNIMLRRREFAMLKSVGMTKRGFSKMMDFECILYGVRALVFGIPVSVLITFWIYNVTDSGISADFYLPWAAIGIAVLSVFTVVFATMMYAMSKIKKDNLIDALKNENA